jgi:hypothetical protein
MFEVINQRGDVIALAHVFILPDGAYGGSGKLDPKVIRAGRILYHL